MADNVVTVVTGTNDSVALAAASLDTALSDIDTGKTVFLCDIYQSNQLHQWHHVLIHQS
jgi:hypothetical protein